MLSSGMNYAKAMQYIKEEYGDNVAKEIDEDIGAYSFEAGIWSCLKNTFGVRDFNEDVMLSVFTKGKETYVLYLTYAYNLGLDHKKDKTYTREEYEKGRSKLENNKNNTNYTAFIAIWQGYIKNLQDKKGAKWEEDSNIDEYTIFDLEKDLNVAFGVSLLSNGKSINNEKDKEELEKDYENLLNNIAGANGYLKQDEIDKKYNFTTQIKTGKYTEKVQNDYNKEKYKDILSLQFVNLFEKLITKGGKEKFDIIKNNIISCFNTTNIGYQNSMIWMFELYTKNTYELYKKYASKQKEYFDNYYSSSNLNSFINYYMGLDKDKLNEVAKALSGIKNITVTDSKLTNGMNTHFIANADFLIKAFNALKNEGWKNFTWSEGYRSYKDFKNIFKGGSLAGFAANGHANNCAMDIMINSGFTLNNLINFAIANFNNGTFYRIELKNYGFHLEEYKEGSKKTREILFGNNRGDTIEVFLKYMYEEGKITMIEYDALTGYYKDKYYYKKDEKGNDTDVEDFISLTKDDLKDKDSVEKKMSSILNELRTKYNLYLYYLQQLYEAQMNIQSNWEQYYFGQ